MVEEFLVCSVCTRVGENRATSYHDSCINFPFFVSLSAKKEDLLLEEVYFINNYCDEIMASSLDESLS